MENDEDTAPEIGQRVRLRHSGEAGVVVHTWWNEEMDSIDCYVAFFGDDFPAGQPDQVPYVLRYLSMSLEVVD